MKLQQLEHLHQCLQLLSLSLLLTKPCDTNSISWISKTKIHCNIYSDSRYTKYSKRECRRTYSTYWRSAFWISVIKQLQQGKDISINFNKFIQLFIKIFNNKKKIKKVYSRVKSDYEFNSEQAIKQKKIDKILEKIANSGYESLTKEEKQTLFSASKK